MSEATPVSKAPIGAESKSEASSSPNEHISLDSSPKEADNFRQAAGQPEAITARRDGIHIPLSYAQQRIWFSHHLIGASCTYNVPWVLRLRGPLRTEALEASLNEVIRRHEALRTTYVEQDGAPVQIVQASLTLRLTVVDLSEYPEDQRELESQKLIKHEIGTPFDLEKGPLFMGRLLRLGDRDNILLLVLHHIVLDGWSMGILMRELSTLYEAFVQHRPSPLPELAIQYADHTIWQRNWLQGEALERHLAFWKNQLAGLQPLELPIDKVRPSLQSYRGDVQRFALSARLVDDLKTLSQQEHVTLFMVLAAAFQALLQRYSGQDDIAIGTPVAGRTHPELKELIGFFVNTVVLRTDLSGDPSFRELLTKVRKAAWGAYIHQDLPFQMLVEELHPQRDPSRHPLVQVMFILQNAPNADLQLDGVAVEVLPFDTGTAKFDLTFEFSQTSQGLSVAVEYASDLFEAATITRLIGHFVNLLDAIVAQPDAPLSRLTMLSEAERWQLLEGWNNTAAEFPRYHCVHQLFEEQVGRTPDAVAVICEGEELNYGHLNARANQLAHHLRRLGVSEDGLVGICMERSLNMIVGLLGILKAGGAYVPLDPSFPNERLAWMIKDTQIPVLLTQKSLMSRLPPYSGHTIPLDAAWPSVAKESKVNPSTQTSAHNLAYVMYTSGSSGMPKGVEVCHRNVIRLLFGVNYADFKFGKTLLFLAPLAFDASTFELWGALLHGARCIVYTDSVPTAKSLGALIGRHRVTTMWLTSSLFNAFVEDDVTVLRGVGQLLIGGEALSVSHVKRALEMLPDTELINGYGPTENTTFTCCYSIPRPLMESATSIPIGRPIANTAVYVLDPYLNPVPIGVTGELFIGGEGLARGYLNRPDLTAEKFIRNPYSDDSSTRLYKTGDKVRYKEDGCLEFLGRFDDQVKIRGYRIEPVEIESALLQLSALRQAAVVVREEENHDRYLVGYVVLQPGEQASVEAIRNHLKNKIPSYMVPSSFVIVHALPLTPNGKVDKRALLSAPSDSLNLQPDYVAPRNEAEQELANIWAELLPAVPIGVHDNFFDLGGHSLLAVRMLARIIEKWPYQDITLAILVQRPTVAELADLFLSGKQISMGCFVPYRKSGAKPPFFCVPGAGGNVLSFRHLAAAMSNDRPFYCLQAKGLDGTEPHRTVEEAAEYYVQGIREIQPEGPYYLAGGSSGGLVAFEMACRLKEQGSAVGPLVLLDTFNFAYGHSLAKPRLLYENLRFYLRRCGYHIRNMRNIAGKDSIRYLSGRIPALRHYLTDLLAVARGESRNQLPVQGLPHELGQEAGMMRDTLNRVAKSSLDAARNYVPQYYDGEVILFKASECQDVPYQESTLGWSPFVREVQTVEVQGDHKTIFSGPQVQSVARVIEAAIEQ